MIEDRRIEEMAELVAVNPSLPQLQKGKSKSNEHSLEQCHDGPLPVICFGEDERAGAVEYLRERTVGTS